MSGNAPLTAYLCALIDVAEGRTTADKVRERWAKGEFKGVRQDWAAAYAKDFGIRTGG